MSEGSGGGGPIVVELGIDGYEQAVEIARGGFSVVFRAWDRRFERHVAIKVLSANLETTEVDRFARECAAIGRLEGHPNIITVHDAGRLPTGHPYIVMEFLSEGSLASRLEKGPLDWREATDVGVKLAGALESAHAARVLHRDVKPGNVMLSRYGNWKLGDFGIARMEGGSETESSRVAASWVHAPPEVVNGARPSVASDVYSLASTLFTLLDGRPPFGLTRPESFVAQLSHIVRDPIRPFRTAVPEEVDRVIRKGLAKDPAERQASAAEFGRELQAVQAALRAPVTTMPLATDVPPGSDVPATEYVDLPSLPQTDPRRPPEPMVDRPDRSRWWLPLVAAAVAAVVVVVVAASLMDGDGGGQAGVTTATIATTTSTTAGSAAVPSGPTTSAAQASTATGASSPPTGGVRLGQGLPPISTEPCRTPLTGTGAAWQLAPLQLGGRPFDVAYYCNLLAGGTGSLDFVLGGSYRLLTTSIGFADGSASTSHLVRFEFIAEGRENLLDPITVRFGDVRDLQIDVTGVTRLKVRITELNPPGGSEGASQPVLAAPTLTS